MEPISISSIKSKHVTTLLGALVLVAIAMMVPHAFAQQSNPIGYTDGDMPHGPVEPMAWAAAMVTAGIASGIGVWTVVRKH